MKISKIVGGIKPKVNLKVGENVVGTDNRKNQVENLKSILKGLGITTSEELDIALADALESMTIGIMTETIKAPANSA